MCVVILMVGVVSTAGDAQQQAGIRLVPHDTIRFEARPGATDIAASAIHGDIKQKALYVVQVKFSKGAKALPHTHPDERILNVLAGTICFGTGTQFDEAALKPLAAGSVVIIPPNAPHFVWAKDGEAVTQESGFGPSGTIPWPKASTQ